MDKFNEPGFAVSANDGESQSQEDGECQLFGINSEQWLKTTESNTYTMTRTICHEIIDQAINQATDKLLGDASYAYVVHCTYLDWVQFFEVSSKRFSNGHI